MTSLRPSPLKRLPDVDSVLAYLSAPLLPYLKRTKTTGAKDVFFELPEERWTKTGALTGSCWHE